MPAKNSIFSQHTKLSAKETLVHAVKYNMSDIMLKEVFTSTVEHLSTDSLREMFIKQIEETNDDTIISSIDTIIKNYWQQSINSTSEKVEKIIFIDFDGVLNKSSENDGLVLEKELLQNLKELCDATGAKVVLSTYWRFDWSDNDENKINKIFKEAGIEIYSRTESYDSRMKEIQEWLILRNIDKYIVIDDCYHDFSLDVINHNFIKTESTEGLTKKLVVAAIKILNS